jgi:splicing factor 45
MRRRQTSDYDSEESDRRPSMNSETPRPKLRTTLNQSTEQFAPPPSMSFAPPPDLNAEPAPPPPPQADIPDDPTGEDAYARRMRLSQQQVTPHAPPPPSPPRPPPSIAPPGQISAAPVRYTIPAPPAEPSMTRVGTDPKPAESNTPEPDSVRSSRPGQAGFAERLLSKYGWTKGSGLGAQGTGIINPLYAKVDKRKKKPDSEGGGFVTPATTARILGGNKSKSAKEEEEGKFGKMSEVIRLQGMLRGLDVDAEIDREEGGGLMQEIGEECAGKYGAVERVFIHRDEVRDADADGPMVFVQFVSPLSALRAVNALEGRVFGGNVIRARFWGKEDFEEGRYV